MLIMLIDVGSDINAKDAKGRTALHLLAADRSHDEHENRRMGASLPLARGIDVWARNGEGKTAADLLGPGDGEIARLLSASMKIRRE